MLNKIKSYLMSGQFWAGFAAGAVVGLAFRRFIPAPVKNLANAIPGSDAKANG